MINSMLRRATYWTSGPDDNRVTAQDVSEQKEYVPTQQTQWRTHFLANMVDKLSVLHVVHEIQEGLDRGQDHS